MLAHFSLPLLTKGPSSGSSLYLQLENSINFDADQCLLASIACLSILHLPCCAYRLLLTQYMYSSLVRPDRLGTGIMRHRSLDRLSSEIEA